MKKILLILFYFTFVNDVYAVSISEIMFDPQGSDTGREWVEIFNDTSAPVDLTVWKFFENNTNHGIVSYQGGSSIPVSGYAVIADNPQKFLIDYPNYQGVLYDSSFSLSNGGEQIALKDSLGAQIDSINYNTLLGGNDDGSTLSLINASSSWVRGRATPGLENIKEEKVAVNISTTTNNTATIAQMSPPGSDIILFVPFEKTVVAGADTEFDIFGMNHNGNPIDGLNCFWSFGDGGQGSGTTTLYAYAYAGYYLANVECGNSHVLGNGVTKVRVVAPDIFISSFGDGKYGNYVEINNPNDYDLNFSNWMLNIDHNVFMFPKNTVLAKNLTTKISGRAMGFASTTINASSSLVITFPNNEEVTRYRFGDFIVEQNMASSSQILKVSTSTKNLVVKKSTSQQTKAPFIVAEAQATSTKYIKENQNNKKDVRIITWIKSFFRI